MTQYADGRDARCQCQVYETCQYCRPGAPAPMTDPTLEPTFTAEDYDRAAARMQADTEQARANWADATSDTRITADEEVALWAAHYARRSVLTAMLRFAARRARQAAWQPIETAPTADDTPILLWAPHATAVGYFDNGEWWVLGGNRGGVIDATHWMPLPEPPSQ